MILLQLLAGYLQMQFYGQVSCNNTNKYAFLNKKGNVL